MGSVIGGGACVDYFQRKWSQANRSVDNHVERSGGLSGTKDVGRGNGADSWRLYWAHHHRICNYRTSGRCGGVGYLKNIGGRSVGCKGVTGKTCGVPAHAIIVGPFIGIASGSSGSINIYGRRGQAGQVCSKHCIGQKLRINGYRNRRTNTPISVANINIIRSRHQVVKGICRCRCWSRRDPRPPVNTE